MGRSTDENAGENAISVVSLLRREGLRVPHAADRPLQPRGHQIVPAQAQPSWITSAVGRRAGGAAGAIIAVASVLGAAVLTDASGGGAFIDPTPLSPSAPGATAPGGGAGSLPGLSMPPGVSILPDGAVSLAAFEAAQGRGGAPASILVPGASSSGPGGIPGVSVPTAQQPVTQQADGGLGGVVDGLGDYAGQSLTGLTKTTGDTVTGVTKGLGSTADRTTDAVGNLVGGPVGDVVSGVGDAAGGLVEGTGKTLGHTVSGVGTVLGETTNGVTDTLGGVLGGGRGGSTTTARDEQDDDQDAHDGDDGDGDRESALSSLDNGTGGDGLLGSLGKTASGLLGGGR